MNSANIRKAIAIDFDGCLCTDAFPAIGEPNWDVINRARAEQRSGAGLILWTCREGELLQEAIDACSGWGVTFDSVNESLPDWIEAFGSQPRKVGATEYWDDKAVHMPIIQQPLTPEELREIDGEPVWVVSQDGRNESCWMLVDAEYNLCREAHGGMAVFENNGKTWMAYRRKPESEAGML